MTRNLRALVAALLLCCSTTVAQAGPGTYKCEILQIVEMSNDGHIVEHKGMWKDLVGDSFTVNRKTGEMIGFPFATEGWLGGVKVLNPGGDGDSYKALVLSGQPHVSVKYIYIAEIADGPSKPFWGSGDDRVIFSGTCF